MNDSRAYFAQQRSLAIKILSSLLFVCLVAATACQRKGVSPAPHEGVRTGKVTGQSTPTISSVILAVEADTAYIENAVRAEGHLKASDWQPRVASGEPGSIVVTLHTLAGDTLAMKRFHDPHTEELEAPIELDAPGTHVTLQQEVGHVHVRSAIPFALVSVARDTGTGFEPLAGHLIADYAPRD